MRRLSSAWLGRRITDGRVPCPTYGMVDVETCFTCGHLRRIDADDDEGFVRCRPPEPTGRSLDDFAHQPPF